MPSKSKAQHNFMAAVAHNPAFAKKAGVPQSVGKDFSMADKGKKFSKGGEMKTNAQFDADIDRVKRGLFKNKDDKKIYSRERGMGPGMAAKRLEERGVDLRGLVANEQNPEDLGNYKKGGKVKHEDVKMDKKMMQKAVNKHEGRLHKGSTMTKLASGGMPMVMKDGQKVPAFAADGKGKMAKGGMTKKMNMGGMAYAKGGFTKSADGIATKGKTKGMQVKMRGGGMC